MKKIYDAPSVEFVEIEDVILTSGCENELPNMEDDW